MRCPVCGSERTRVVDSRPAGGDGGEIRRRRECDACGQRFTTFERIEFSLPQVIKRGGRRVTFSDHKLRESFRLALHKRPVPTARVDDAIENIRRELATSGRREVTSSRVGNMVLEALFQLDPVAYIRFASVYLSFADVQAFREVIERLEKDLTPEMRKHQIPLLGDEEQNGQD